MVCLQIQTEVGEKRILRGYSFRKDIADSAYQHHQLCIKTKCNILTKAFLLLANVRAQLPGSAWLAGYWHMHLRFGITCVACDAGISRPEDCSRSVIAWPEHRNTSDHHHGHWMHESYFLPWHHGFYMELLSLKRLWLLTCVSFLFQLHIFWRTSDQHEIPP